MGNSCTHVAVNDGHLKWTNGGIAIEASKGIEKVAKLVKEEQKANNHFKLNLLIIHLAVGIHKLLSHCLRRQSCNEPADEEWWREINNDITLGPQTSKI